MGLSTDEAEKLRKTCISVFAEFYDLASKHSQSKEEPFAGGIAPSVKLVTEAFPDEGSQLRDKFKGELVSLLGQARAEVFWQQATPTFTEVFNDFGSFSRELQHIHNPNHSVELLNHQPGSTSIGLLSQRNGMPLPPALQTYADAWNQETDSKQPTEQQP